MTEVLICSSSSSSVIRSLRGVLSKKKIVVLQLLQWHMKDVTDDNESLKEWIYSKLSRSGTMVMGRFKRNIKSVYSKNGRELNIWPRFSSSIAIVM